MLYINWPLWKRRIPRPVSLVDDRKSQTGSKKGHGSEKRGSKDDGGLGTGKPEGGFGEEEEEETESSPLLSEKFLRHQQVIDATHRKMAGNKSALTSFY